MSRPDSASACLVPSHSKLQPQLQQVLQPPQQGTLVARGDRGGERGSWWREGTVVARGDRGSEKRPRLGWLSGLLLCQPPDILKQWFSHILSSCSRWSWQDIQAAPPPSMEVGLRGQFSSFRRSGGVGLTLRTACWATPPSHTRPWRVSQQKVFQGQPPAPCRGGGVSGLPAPWRGGEGRGRLRTVGSMERRGGVSQDRWHAEAAVSLHSAHWGLVRKGGRLLLRR